MEFEELMHENMLQEAFMDLENGHLMPWDKILLAGSPLPESITQPYTTREVSDVRESMRLTYETMSVWIEESKNESYFSKRFVQLSRMIMNGVTTIGRGLITLHARGEEPRNVPMSVQDLIGVASYQFRKSHLGVLQTVRSHPEISERLMMNQIGWNNMLMRLFKTKEKLAKPVVNAELASNSECGRRNEESLPDTKSASNHGHALPDAAALFEPGALCAPRAFSSLDGSKSPAISRRHALGTSSEKCGMRDAEPLPNSECGMRNAEFGFVNSEARISEPEEKAPETETPEALTEKKECGSVVKETATGPAEEKIPEAETQRTSDEPKGSDPERKRTENKEPHSGKPVRNNFPGDSDKRTGDDPGKTEQLHEVSADNLEQSGPVMDPSGKPDDTEREEGEELHGDFSEPVAGEQIHETKYPADDPPGLSPGPVEGPFYLEILRHAFSRSADNEDGKIIFSADEICYLAHDPAFAEIYPDQVADMRRILAQINEDAGTVA